MWLGVYWKTRAQANHMAAFFVWCLRARRLLGQVSHHRYPVILYYNNHSQCINVYDARDSRQCHNNHYRNFDTVVNITSNAVTLCLAGATNYLIMPRLSRITHCAFGSHKQHALWIILYVHKFL